MNVIMNIKNIINVHENIQNEHCNVRHNEHHTFANWTLGKVPIDAFACVDSRTLCLKNPPTIKAPSPVSKPFWSLLISLTKKQRQSLRLCLASFTVGFFSAYHMCDNRVGAHYFRF